MALPGQVYAYGRALEVLVATSYVDSQVMVSLHSSAYVPNTSHAYFSDTRGEIVGGGYGQRKLQGREMVFDTAVQRFQLKATRVEFPLVTLTARYAVIRQTTEGGPDLLAWVDLLANRQVFNGTLSISWENDMILEVQGVG